MPTEASPAPQPEPMVVDSKEPPFRLLFADTFTRASDDRVDEIMFTTTVIVKEIRVIRGKEIPHSKLGFTGSTKPSSFLFQVFGLDALDRFTSRFEPLTPKVRYVEQSSGPLPCLKDLVTDHLVVRGDYETLSLCIYGCFESDVYPQEPSPKKKEVKKEPIKLATKPSLPLKPFDLFSAREFEKVMFEPWKDKSYSILSFSIPQFQAQKDDTLFCDLVSDVSSVPEDSWKDLLPPVLERVDAVLCESPKGWLESIGQVKDEDSAEKEALRLLVEFLARVLTRRPSVLLLKLVFSLLSRLFCSEIAAATFVDLEGLDFSYHFLHDELTCSSLKELCLYCLSYCLYHSYALQRFLQPGEHGETGYQMILSLLTESPPPPGRIFFAVNQVLTRATVYHCVVSVHKSASDLLAEDESQPQASTEHQVATLCLDLKRLLQVLGRECRVVSKQNSGIGGVGPFARDDMHAAFRATVEQERAKLRQIVQEREKKAGTPALDPSLLPLVRDFPDFILNHLKHEKFLSVATRLLTIKSLPAALRTALFSEIRNILLLLVGTFNGMLFLACDPQDLKLLLQVLDRRVTEGPPERWGSSLSLCALHPLSEPSLLSCQRHPDRVSAASLACIIVRQLRALALVNCVISPPDGDSHLAAFHFLHLMTSSPVGAHLVSWVLFCLNAFSSQNFLDFFVSPQIEAKIEPSKVAVPANSQYAVSLLLTLMQSPYFGYVVPQLTPQLLAFITGLTELKTSKQFKSHVTQVISRLEAAVVIKDRGMSGLSHLVDRLCKSKTEEERAFVSIAEDDVKTKEKDLSDSLGANDPGYPIEVVVGASSAFKLLTFLAFSPSNDLITGLLKKGWATNHLLVLCNSLFTNKLIIHVVNLLNASCNFCCKEAPKLKDVSMVEAHLDLLETLCVMIALMVSKMQEANIEKARDTRIVKALLRVHSTISTEFKLFPHFFTLSPALPAIGAEPSSTLSEPLYSDSMIRLRSAISQTLSVYFMSGWNDVEKEFLDVLFAPKSLLPALQLGSLVLFGDMLPPLLHEFIQEPVKGSEARLRQYQHARQQWADLLAPYSQAQNQPSTSLPTLLLLLDWIKSSSVDIHDALIRLLVHLVELSDDLGIALLEPLVDRTRAEILHVSSRTNVVPQEHLTHLYLLRLLQTLARLLENSCCRWVLNEVSVTVAMRPLLQLKSSDKATFALQLLALEVIRLACDVTHGFRDLATEGNVDLCRQYIVSQSPSSADLQVILPDVLRLLSQSSELAVRRMCTRVLTTLTQTQFGVGIMLTLITPSPQPAIEPPCVLRALQEMATNLASEETSRDQEMELAWGLIHYLNLVAKDALGQGLLAPLQVFVGWKVPTDSQHPLVKLVDHFQKAELPETQKFVDLLSSLIAALSSLPVETPEPQPVWNNATPLAERYKSLDGMLRTQSSLSSLYFPFSRSVALPSPLPLLPSDFSVDEAGCFQFPNIFEETVTPTPQLIQAPPQAELPFGIAGAEGTNAGVGLNANKKKFEGKQGRYSTNSFRSRKIGTGRKPSVHVDDFVKQAEEKRPGGQQGSGMGPPHAQQGMSVHLQPGLPPPLRNEPRDGGVLRNMHEGMRILDPGPMRGPESSMRGPELGMRGQDGGMRGLDSGMRGPDMRGSDGMRCSDGGMRASDGMRGPDSVMRGDAGMQNIRGSDGGIRDLRLEGGMNSMRGPDTMRIPESSMRGDSMRSDSGMRGPDRGLDGGVRLESGTRIPDGGMRGLDGMRGSEGGMRGPDSGMRGPDSGMRGPDSGMRGPDSGMRGPDSGMRGPDIGMRGPDRGPDSGMRGPDSGMRGPDIGMRGPDSGMRGPDSGMRGPDIGMRGPDIGMRGPDSGMRGPDIGMRGAEVGMRGSDNSSMRGLDMRGTERSDPGMRGFDGMRGDPGLRMVDQSRPFFEGMRPLDVMRGLPDPALRKLSGDMNRNDRGIQDAGMRPMDSTRSDPQMRNDSFRGPPQTQYDQPRPTFGVPLADIPNTRPKRTRTSPNGGPMAPHPKDMSHLGRPSEDDKRRRVNSGGSARAFSPPPQGQILPPSRGAFSRSPTPKINAPSRNFNNFPNSQRKDRGDFEPVPQRTAPRPSQGNSQLPTTQPPLSQQPRQPQQWPRRQ